MITDEGNTDTSSLEVSNPDETWSPPKNIRHEASQGRVGRASTGKRRGMRRAKGIGRESGEVEVGSAARGRARGRQRSSTRGTHAARGRGNTASLSEEDRLRVARLQEDRRLMTQEVIQDMCLDDARGLLLRVFNREPGLILDVLQPNAHREEQPLQGVPGWCFCTNCREMPSDVENKCCGMTEATCISKLPHMSLYILDEHVLRLSRRLRNDIYALHDTQQPGDDNREYRYAAYRNYVLWQCGSLGPRNRVVIPSCCVCIIREKYPDPNGQYTGFIADVL